MMKGQEAVCSRSCWIPQHTLSAKSAAFGVDGDVITCTNHQTQAKKKKTKRKDKHTSSGTVGNSFFLLLPYFKKE